MKLKSNTKLEMACAFLFASLLSNAASAQQGLPDGLGKTEFVHNCTACHRADMVTRVKKTPEDWRKSVDEMASRGTDGTKEDLDNAYLYLVKNYSIDKPEGAAHPAMPPAGSPRPNSADARHAERISFGASQTRLINDDRVRYLVSLPPLQVRLQK
jgi:hypothetical protein